jgi:hypothetical protein
MTISSSRSRPVVAYIIFANAVILFLLVVTITHLALTRYHHLKVESLYESLSEPARRNYSHMAPADVNDLLRTTATMRYRFAPWVGVRERPTTSRFVNVNGHGIRSNGKPVENLSAIKDAIWFYGGSTTFGYGVTDAETIPAQLETAVGRPVMNFGVAGSFSARENLLLVQTLRLGYRPAAVVFLDGINESCEVVDGPTELDPNFEKLLDRYRWDPVEIAKPVLYAAFKLGERFGLAMGRDPEAPTGNELICERPEGSQPLRTVHARLLAERDVLCRLYALPCTTFVQPFAGVHGRHDDLRSLPEPSRRQNRELFAHLEGNWRAANAVFVTDALDHHPAHAFIDDVHYSKDACALIARAMAQHLRGQLRTTATTAGPSATVPAR